MIVCFSTSSICSNPVIQEILLSLIGSFLVFVIVAFRYRVINYFRYLKLVGEYIGFEKQSEQPHSGKLYTFNYHFIANKISVDQKSNDKGNWKAMFMIDQGSPYVFVGRYDYLEGKNYSGDWGLMTVWVNTDKNEIVVESLPKNREGKGPAEYILRK